MEQREFKRDSLGKACLKTLGLLVALSVIGFVLSYIIVLIFKTILHLNNSYTIFEYVYKEGVTNKYFSSTSTNVLMQSIIYMVCLLVMFYLSLKLYFRKYYLSNRDSIIYTLFVLAIIFISSFILINVTINYLNDLIREFNEMILTYSLDGFSSYLKKLANVRIIVVVIYSIGAIGSCILCLFTIKDSKKKNELNVKVVKKVVVEPKVVESVKEEDKEEQPKDEVPEVQEDVVNKEEPIEIGNELPIVNEVKEPEIEEIVYKEEVKKEDINLELDEEELRIVNEINELIDKDSKIDKNMEKIALPKERKKNKKVSFVGQSNNKKNKK